MKTRKATLADSSDIARLTLQLGYSADITEIKERLARILQRSDCAVYVAEDDDSTLLGWIQVHTLDVLESGLKVEIVGLIVAEKARRRGVGGILMQCAEAWTRKNGLEEIVVRSNSQRIESHLFYPAQGFHQTKTQTVYRKILIL